MKIALAQINPTVGDFAGNAKKILEYASRAEALGVGLVVFPELAVCGYPPADLLEKASFVARAEEVAAELAQWTTGVGRPAILCGTVMATKASVGKQVRNVAALLDGGKLSFVQQKMLLPFYDVFDEQRYFEPAVEQALVCVRGEPLAITVCEDAWNDKSFWPRQMYPVDPVEKLMGQWEAQSQDLVGRQRVILNISASPYWQGKQQVRQSMLAALARRHGAFVAMANQVGGNDSLVFDGTSLVIRPDGEVVAQAASFAEDLIVFDMEDGAAGAVEKPVDEVAAMWDALVLGTRDYVRKCGFSKVLVGLSGGIDSALVAAIAVEALGKENVIGVGMPTEYSSLGSIEDAKNLAKNLGVRFELLPVHDVFAQFQFLLQPLFKGTPFGLAEENLQPRIRGTLLMALSNKFGALVLTTGNKSEMSTGYCTLYGDMVGALAVIGDVMKTRVYALSRYVNRTKEVIPWETISKPPSAELRPGQQDTDSLPPYEVLDPILEAYVERYCSAEQIAEEQGVDVALVRSVLQLVEKSEYKRQQAAPVLKVTRKSFGMGRRFPIAVKVQV
ncbi:NAD+ synthase [Tunturiibacter gelidoferens]|uniref:Glutamine-dependent NAD(+) synthetase n=1 Tax=Tunturiibacter gelidiferens TaxID=3069689 RepID=A0A9X0QD60_9BACT|nr:NAD+ synthase [Edaphobacter lichenicola]MBB5328155.1 NAD+ synthase (glutamine-hydrolyzing) [Edaphobacter lichenicola]